MSASRSTIISDHHYAQQTVTAAKIAAELHHTKSITLSLSITSKNLHALVKRIGRNAAGLAVLASFYDECSAKTMDLASRIGAMTTQSATQAVSDWRISLLEDGLRDAIRDVPEAQIPNIINKHLTNKSRRLKSERARSKYFHKELSKLLIDMQQNIRSISVIAVNSKIEAPKSGEHQAVLVDMSNNVEKMIDQILRHINVALGYLPHTGKR